MDHVLFKILNVWSLGLKDATNVLKDTELIKMVDVNMLMNTVGTSVSKVTAPIVTDCTSWTNSTNVKSRTMLVLLTQVVDVLNVKPHTICMLVCASPTQRVAFIKEISRLVKNVSPDTTWTLVSVPQPSPNSHGIQLIWTSGQEAQIKKLKSPRMFSQWEKPTNTILKELCPRATERLSTVQLSLEETVSKLMTTPISMDGHLQDLDSNGLVFFLIEWKPSMLLISSTSKEIHWPSSPLKNLMMVSLSEESPKLQSLKWSSEVSKLSTSPQSIQRPSELWFCLVQQTLSSNSITAMEKINTTMKLLQLGFNNKLKLPSLMFWKELNSPHLPAVLIEHSAGWVLSFAKSETSEDSLWLLNKAPQVPLPQWLWSTAKTELTSLVTTTAKRFNCQVQDLTNSPQLWLPLNWESTQLNGQVNLNALSPLIIDITYFLLKNQNIKLSTLIIYFVLSEN